MAICVQCTCAACGNTMTPNASARERIDEYERRLTFEIQQNSRVKDELRDVRAGIARLEATKGLDAVELVGSIAGPGVGLSSQTIIGLVLHPLPNNVGYEREVMFDGASAPMPLAHTAKREIEINVKNVGHERAFMIFVVRPKTTGERHEALEQAALAMMKASERLQKGETIGTPSKPEAPKPLVCGDGCYYEAGHAGRCSDDPAHP